MRLLKHISLLQCFVLFPSWNVRKIYFLLSLATLQWVFFRLNNYDKVAAISRSKIFVLTVSLTICYHLLCVEINCIVQDGKIYFYHNRPTSSEHIFLISDYYDCNEPLLEQAALSATSFLDDRGPGNARLNGKSITSFNSFIYNLIIGPSLTKMLVVTSSKNWESEIWCFITLWGSNFTKKSYVQNIFPPFFKF